MKRFLFIALTVITTISLFIVLFGEKINYTPNHIEVSSNQKTTIDIKNTSDEIAYVWVDCSCKYVNTNDQVNHRKLYTIHSGESIRISTLNFDLDENEIYEVKFDVHEKDIKREFFTPIKPYCIGICLVSIILIIIIYLKVKKSKRKRK